MLDFDQMAQEIDSGSYSTNKQPRGYLGSDPGEHVCRIAGWEYLPTTNSGKTMYMMELDIISSTIYPEGTELKQSLVVSGIPSHIIKRVNKNIQDIAFLTLDKPITPKALKENVNSEKGHVSQIQGKIIKITVTQKISEKTGRPWSEYFYSVPKERETLDQANPMQMKQETAAKLDAVFGKDEVEVEDVPDFNV